jgi:ribosome biogenesis protein MAK21
MKAKKNKPLAAETAASADVGIGSDALARLAEKLKTDLAKPEPQSKQKASPRSDISGTKKSKSKETGRHPNKVTAEKAAANHKAAVKGKELPSLKSNGGANPGKIDKVKEHKKQSPQDGKTKPKPPSQSALSPKCASSSKPISTKRNRTGEKSSQKDKPEKDSLLEEVIALGGTEADLELIDGINSDEDVEGDLSSVQKRKGTVGNDKSVHAVEYRTDYLATDGITGTTQILGIDRPIP